MADRINELIQKIREKVSQLKDQLSVEKTNNESLQNEVNQLKAQLNLSLKEVESLETKVVKLQSDIVKAKEQSVGGSNESEVSDEQIDELVKEIEYCIGQLKK
jgi:predicted  nucleic acid-binding Zn-ribbon protein